MVVAAAVAVVLTLCLLQRSSGQEIINVNEDSNETIFLGSGVNFERDCFSPDPSSAVQSFEWLLNGQPHSSIAGHLLVNEVTLQSTGEYSCRATLMNGSHVGPISAGFLTVLDPDEHITAPARQHAILHGNTTLQCSTSLPNAVIVWSRNGGNVNAFISNITLESEGIYVCRVFLRDSNAGINIEVQLHVIVPPVIVSSPPAYQLITGNVPHNLTVIFQGSADAEVFSVMVSWYKDGSNIPDSRIETSSLGDVSDTERVTQLRFDPIRKVDRGVYRVEVEITLNDAEWWRTETSFQVAVEVPPTPPANLEVVDITPTSARVTWDLTNQNTDAAADTLTVTLFHPNNQTVVCEHLLPGNRTDATLSLTPGLEYWVSVSTHNSDGARTSQQVRFQSQPAAPFVSSLVMTRINETAFQLTAVLNYTGGGDITHFTVQFREIGTEIWGPSVEIPAIPSPNSSLVWNGVIVDSEFAGQPILEFNVSLINTAMLESFHETTEFIESSSSSLSPTAAIGGAVGAVVAIVLVVLVVNLLLIVFLYLGSLFCCLVKPSEVEAANDGAYDDKENRAYKIHPCILILLILLVITLPFVIYFYCCWHKKSGSSITDDKVELNVRIASDSVDTRSSPEATAAGGDLNYAVPGDIKREEYPGTHDEYALVDKSRKKVKPEDMMPPLQEAAPMYSEVDKSKKQPGNATYGVAGKNSEWDNIRLQPNDAYGSNVVRRHRELDNIPIEPYEQVSQNIAYGIARRHTEADYIPIEPNDAYEAYNHRTDT